MNKILDERFYKHYSLEELENEMLSIINKQTEERFIIPKNDVRITLVYNGEGEQRDVTFREIYQEYFGWDKQTTYYKFKYRGIDLRTAKYLDSVIKNTGLVNKEVDYDEEEFITKEKVNVWVNLLYDVIVGKVKNGLWCAQWVEAGIDDYNVIRLYFNRKPSKNTLQTLDLVEKIMYLGDFGVFKPEFKCIECGRKFHWLDIEGSIFKKYEALEDKLCGDEISE